MDYKYGNKNNWRRWEWNRISERVDDPRTATVLYLAGEADLDRKIALEHGFRDNNMIAVERDQRTLTSLRGKGVLAIDGELLPILKAWPDGRKVDAVVGDFCCGFEKSLIPLATKAPWMPWLSNAVFSFNFLRGRDPSSSVIRQCAAMAFQEQTGVPVKHRGLIFFYTFTQVLLYSWQDLKWSNEKQMHALENVVEYCDPAMRSYKSTANQIFDSLIFCSPLSMFDMGIDYWQNHEMYHDGGKGMPERRRIAAILAHQTMRAKWDSVVLD